METGKFQFDHSRLHSHLAYYSYVGFDTAQEFSPLFGPPLMVFFAILANTLLLTILISLLSNTFSVVAQNASEEAMYQHACLTLNGISTDALFSYMPPLNLLAIIIIMPASFVLTPRWLHKLNVALLQFTSWPLLVMIKICSVSFRTPSSIASSPASYMESTAEKASHLLSWLPLPRSRTNPDRDIIEAAFIQAKNKPNDWEEWSASMIQIRENSNDSNGSKLNQVDVRNGTPNQLSTSSPLARIFGSKSSGKGKKVETETNYDSIDLLPLLKKLEEQEKSQKRIEELLIKLMESK